MAPAQAAHPPPQPHATASSNRQPRPISSQDGKNTEVSIPTGAASAFPWLSGRGLALASLYLGVSAIQGPGPGM